MSIELWDLDADLHIFISDAREVFRGESWEQVRSYLELVWLNSGLSDHAAWADIEARVKSEWDAA
jgi:hypothetical protein